MEQQAQAGEIKPGHASRPAWWRVALLGRNPKWTLARVIVFAAVCFLGRDFVLLPIRVEGISMSPTYRERSINFVNRLAYLFDSPRRGDVVAIRLLAGPHVMFMKRIVGLPGETIGFHDGRLLVNGRVLDEPYVKGDCDWEVPPKSLEPNEYYVVGDNRSMPVVDHMEGRVQRAMIVGKVLL